MHINRTNERGGRSTHRSICTLAISALLVAACGSTATTTPPVATASPGGATAGQSTATPAKTGGTLIFAFSQPPDSLDPALANTSTSAMIDQDIFDRLVWKRPGDSTYTPGLATSWDISPDAKEYTFHLRQDVKFQDGTPFNAQAVKFTFDRIANPATKAGLAGSALSVASYASTTVSDDYTAKVLFNQPNGSFLNMLTTIYLAPLSPTAVTKWGTDFQDHLVGTGPYMLKEYVHGDHVTLVRNPDYKWAPSIFKHQGAAYLDAIEYRQISDDSTRVAALKSGEVTLIDTVAAPDFTSLKADPAYQTMLAGTSGQGWHDDMNVINPPTDDPIVRKAVQESVDRATLSAALFAGTLPAFGGIIENNMIGYNPDQEKIVTYDPTDAAKRLDSDGWTMGSDGYRHKNGKTLELIQLQWPGFGMENMTVGIQGMLKEVGIKLDIKSLDFAAGMALMDQKTTYNLQMNFQWYADPTGLEVLYKCPPAVYNYSWTCNPTLEEYLKQGRAAVTDEARAGFYDSAVRWLLNNGVAIPLFSKKVVLAGTNQFKMGDMFLNPEGYPNFYDVSMQ
jgi:peptide/nickel transport system substrate-binding protein